MSRATLVTIPFSHFCERARWALDRAGVAYREEGHMPGFHRIAVRRAGSPGTSVPVLVVGGHVIADSGDILRYADEPAASHAKLYPRDGRTAAEISALEEDYCKNLGPHLRRVLYFHLLARRSIALRLFKPRTPRWQRAAMPLVFPLLRVAMRRMMHIDERNAERSLGEVRRIFDSVEQRLADGRPYLAGDRFTGADLTFAALAAPAVRPHEHPATAPAESGLPAAVGDLLRETRDRPAGAFVRRMYEEHRRSASRSTSPDGYDGR
jgi:glutathione S-transferase